jgi:Fe-S-cluster containining protein
MATLPKTINGKRPKKEDVPSSECLCDYCTAKCCRYFALPIDRPTEQKDLDYIRWYLMHEHASLFVEENAWYLLVHTKCKHLQSDFRCGAYMTRPQICRDYSTDNCEYDDDACYDMYFETSEQMGEYMEAMLASSTSQVIRTPEPAMLPILN